MRSARCVSCEAGAEPAAGADELARLRARRRDTLLRALDAATALKTRLELELAAHDSAAPRPAALRARLLAAHAQDRLDCAVRSARAPLDAAAVRRALSAQPEGPPPPPPLAPPGDPTLLLANYCAALVYSRRAPAALSPPPPPPRALPLYYLSLEVEGVSCGRVVVQLRPDAAPRMCRNFAALAESYRGCSVFQCWEGESVIAGDYELNNGRGGRSAFAEPHFLPDESRLAAVRGALGMRRSQRRRDTLGLVGSQFRIVLREMRGFTAIFGSVVEGLDILDRISAYGDGVGKPRAHIVIADCGLLD